MQHGDVASDDQRPAARSSQVPFRGQRRAAVAAGMAGLAALLLVAAFWLVPAAWQQDRTAPTRARLPRALPVGKRLLALSNEPVAQVAAVRRDAVGRRFGPLGTLCRLRPRPCHTICSDAGDATIASTTWASMASIRWLWPDWSSTTAGRSEGKRVIAQLQPAVDEFSTARPFDRSGNSVQPPGLGAAVSSLAEMLPGFDLGAVRKGHRATFSLPWLGRSLADRLFRRRRPGRLDQ